MFEAADGPRPTCAACRRAWDPIPVVTLLARHVLKGPIAMVVRETTVGSAVHELAQRGAMDGETGGGPPLRVPLAAPGARAWLDQYLRLVQRGMVLLQQGHALRVGDPLDRCPVQAVVLRGGTHVNDVTP